MGIKNFKFNGVKNILTESSIKIFGNPNLNQIKKL